VILARARDPIKVRQKKRTGPAQGVNLKKGERDEPSLVWCGDDKIFTEKRRWKCSTRAKGGDKKKIPRGPCHEKKRKKNNRRGESRTEPVHRAQGNGANRKTGRRGVGLGGERTGGGQGGARPPERPARPCIR